MIPSKKRLFNILSFFLFLAFFHLPIKNKAQEVTKGVLKPLLLSKEALSGIGLKRIKLKNEPDRAFFQKKLYGGKDLSVYVVSSGSWPGTVTNFEIDEFVYMLNGKARLKPEGKDNYNFYSRDFFFAPRGYSGDWEIIASDQYHYELSVITTHRADSTKTNRSLVPVLLDRNALSGITLSFNDQGRFEQVLAEGIELKISLRAEQPGKRTFKDDKAEKFVAVLSGQVQLTDANHVQYLFQTGDFFVLPKGFSGEWTSSGHGLFKSIVVEKSSL